MLTLEEILKMSQEMGVKIEDGISGKHYILDDSGVEVEFSTDMIVVKRKETISYEMDTESFKINLGKLDRMYDFSSSDNPYESIEVIVDDSITNAA